MENMHQHASDSVSQAVDYSELSNIVKAVEPATNVSGTIPEGSKVREVTTRTPSPSGSQPNGIFIYREDVVRCTKHGSLFGIVTEIAGESDSEGSLTDDSDSEEEEDKHGVGDGNGEDGVNMDKSDGMEGAEGNNSLLDGQVRVIWSDGPETTNDISDVEVIDRGFLHGDIVASRSDPTGQLGLVVDVNITVDLLAANGEVIKNISSRDLKRIREFSVGDYVIFGPWLGRIDDVLDNVTVLFDDGSVCKVSKADPLRLKGVSRPVMDDACSPYYPGQRVRAVSSSVFKTSRWLFGLWKANRLEGTVIKVEAASVVVYWIASAYVGVGTNSTTVPAEEQSPKNLTLLSCFSHANWQLGDWCLLPSASPKGANGTSNNSLSETSEGCGSCFKHSEECSMSEFADTGESGCIQSSHTSLVLPDLIHLEHQTLDGKEKGAIEDDPISSSHLDSSSVLDQLIDSVDQSYECTNTFPSSNSKDEFHSRNSDCVKLDITNELVEADTVESDSVILECGSSNGLMAVSKEVNHDCWPLHRKKFRKVLFRRDKKARKRDENFERALSVANIRTKVDVAWQDGTREFGLDSTSLIPIQSPNDHEFFPEQYVVEKTSGEGDDSSEVKRVGVVRTVNSKDRTVCVRWCKPVSRPEVAQEFDCDEVVSAYELDGHPDYDYCYGDVVVRLAPSSNSDKKVDCGSIVDAHKQQDDSAGTGAVYTENNNEHELMHSDDSCANFSSLSWVGNITGLQDGDIEVTWADGMVSMVGPQAVYVVSREDGESFDGGSEVSDAAASWETVDENEMDGVDSTEKEADKKCPLTDSNEKEGTSRTHSEDSGLDRHGPLSVSLAAFGFMTRLATGFFSLGRKQTEQSGSDHIVGEEAETQDVGALEEVANDKHSSDSLDNYIMQNEHEAREECNSNLMAEIAEVKMGNDSCDSKSSEMEMDANNSGPYSKDDFFNFKHFDITQNPLDHHFLGGSGQTDGGRKWVKKIQQEWSILEKNLPDDIYVRVFEDRMDLIRAVIVGACGTPYQDGLFFFDFHLPPEYPQVPPSAYYHSGGLRINPNLYVEGKVCLSLLNTWSGKGNEIWDPSTSSILQVLVSLQGLVLNAKPYFNEAGYEKQIGTIEGEKNSLPYNENTYLLNLKSMTYLLRRPPMHFEDFVKDHFRRCGLFILKACEAYMNGCMIGSLTEDACMTEKSKENPSSVGFKLMLAKMIPRLISVFTEIGVECQQFQHLQKSNPSEN